MAQTKLNIKGYPDTGIIKLRFEANKYGLLDPQIALFKSRLAAEHICIEIIKQHDPDYAKNPNLTLRDLLHKLKNIPQTPSKTFLLHLQTVQNYGNWGSHVATGADGRSPEDTRPCLHALENICRIYSEEYLHTPLPPLPATLQTTSPSTPPLSPGAPEHPDDSGVDSRVLTGVAPVSRWPQLRGRRRLASLIVAALILAALTITTVATLGGFTREAASGGDGFHPQGHELPPFDLKAIPAGTFTQGSPTNEPGRGPGDEVQREVTLTHPFWIATTEVTVAQWQAVMGRDPSYLQCGTDCPVELVSWYDALVFLNRASLIHNLTPCYDLQGQIGEPGTGCPVEDWNDGWCNGELRFAAVHVLESCTGYRLPTEAEWEYAARAGSTGAIYAAEPRLVAWTKEIVPDCPSTDSRRREVGCKRPVMGRQPNAWGLFDTLGNVAEWTWDAERTRTAQPVTDPRYDDGGERVFKGGSWYGDVTASRFGHRMKAVPRNRSRAVGLRVARSWTGEGTSL